jgi:hypothetical protein
MKPNAKTHYRDTEDTEKSNKFKVDSEEYPGSNRMRPVG